MNCPHCHDELIRKEEHDTAIPLGFVKVYYCEAGKKHYAIIDTYEEVSMRDVELTEDEIDTIIGWGGVRSVEWDLEEEELALWLRLKRIIEKEG